jgi:hypothetical protein
MPEWRPLRPRYTLVGSGDDSDSAERVARPRQRLGHPTKEEPLLPRQRTTYPNAPTSCVTAVAISRTIANSRRIGAKISSCSRAYAALRRSGAGSP